MPGERGHGGGDGAGEGLIGLAGKAEDEFVEGGDAAFAAGLQTVGDSARGQQDQCQIDAIGQICHRGITAHATDVGMLRVYRVHSAGKAEFLQIRQWTAGKFRAVRRGADQRNRAWMQQAPQLPGIGAACLYSHLGFPDGCNAHAARPLPWTDFIFGAVVEPDLDTALALAVNDRNPASPASLTASPRSMEAA